MLENPQLLQWVKEAALELTVSKKWIVKKIKTFAVMYPSGDELDWGYIAQVKLEEYDSCEIQYLQIPEQDQNYEFFIKMQKEDIIELIYFDYPEIYNHFTPHISQFLFPFIVSQNL